MELEPLARPDLCGGIHFTADASLDPALYLRELSKRVQAKGGTLHTNTAVLGFQIKAKRITQVITHRGVFQPDHVVLAAGVWSRPLAKQLRLNLPVQPARGYSMTLPRLEAGPQRALQFAERRMAVTPMGARLRCTGRLELSDIRATVDPRQIVSMQQALADYLRTSFEPAPLETWAGLRPATPDGLPLIGRVRRLNNLFVATGHGTLGVSLAAVSGQLVAQLICEETPEIELAPLRVERFGY
jgi:D-amino-acid dehydrogenase